MSVLPATLIIITHRDDARFQKALDCGAYFLETIVIDNQAGSAVAQACNKRGYTHIPSLNPITDFSLERTTAMTHATHEWVFFLDSDEYITLKDAHTLAYHLATTPVTHGITLTRKDIFAGKLLNHGEANIKLTRLVRKSCTTFIYPVHEIAKVTGLTTHSTAVIYHQAHSSVTEFVQKISIYASLAGQHKQLSKPQLLWQLLIFPPAKFMWNYIFRLGFLDGYPGFLYAYLMSLHSLWVRVYIYERTKHTTV